MRFVLLSALILTCLADAADKSAPNPQKIGNAWTDKSNPIVKIFNGNRLDLWSLKPIASPTPPSVRRSSWLRNPIDAFILAKQESIGIEPAAEADRRTLIRRLSFDLRGLPPTSQEVEAFVNDRSADAYDRLVDRFLASPRFGEHQARWWLDVVRYSDSNGFDWDEFRPKAWLFRDYVIRSMIADKPFHRFVREQLAGDEMLQGPPQNTSEQDMLIATGFLRMGPQDNSAGSFNEQARARSDMLFDLVETTGSAFLGMTLSCCRCHDHKHDPVSHADYYRMRAFFAAVKYADDLPLDLASDQNSKRAHNAQVDSRIAGWEKEIETLRSPIRDKLTKEKKKPNDAEIDKELKPEAKQRLDALAKKIEKAKKEKLRFLHGLLMTDDRSKVETTRILSAGDYQSPREEVSPGFLSLLDPNAAPIPKPANPNTTGRRLALANWIVSPTNPLTARVIVNRIWQNYFGRGIVATPIDFGYSGDRPTHPQLLDWLATRLVTGGWSLKSIHRLIVTSATYRQASIAESNDARLDEYYAKQRIRRLSAEQLRDAMLAAAGTLNDRIFGKPVWPQLPNEVLQANPAFLDDNAEKTKGWYPSPESEQSVRSIYFVQKRTVRIPFMEAFDLPENTVPCGRRNCSIVAPQALAMLNSQQTLVIAKAFANRVRKEAGSGSDQQVVWTFKNALQRLPTTEEHQLCHKLLSSRGLEELCRALLNINEFAFVD